MVDRPEESAGAVNWTLAIGGSVVIHAVLLGLCWLGWSGRSGSEAEPEEPEAEAPAETAPAELPSAPAPVPVEPGVVEYTVKPGDFPGRIASRNGCTLADLRRLNGDVIDKTLHPGQILKIPAKN